MIDYQEKYKTLKKENITPEELNIGDWITDGTPYSSGVVIDKFISIEGQCRAVIDCDNGGFNGFG